MPSWKERLSWAIDKRLQLSLPHRNHRSQALALMMTAPSAPGPPAAAQALAALAQELARATLTADDPIDDKVWRFRRAAAAGAYALAEVRTLSDTSPGLEATQRFARDIVGGLGGAADAPGQLRVSLKAGLLTAASAASAALSFLPPRAVGAVPQLLPSLLGAFAERAEGAAAHLAEAAFTHLLDTMPAGAPMPSPPGPPPMPAAEDSGNSEAAAETKH